MSGKERIRLGITIDYRHPQEGGLVNETIVHSRIVILTIGINYQLLIVDSHIVNHRYSDSSYQYSDARVKRIEGIIKAIILYTLLLSYSWVFNLLSFTLIGYFILVLALEM